GGWDALFLVTFVGCGISRLARYNVTASALSDETGKVTHFEGLPIPTSLLLVALVAALAALGRWQDHLPLGALSFAGLRLHPLSVIFGLHGSAMVSKTLRIPKP
ncbi:MAG TPA: CDP-diacylglycerol--serine O-phosphatidyltransferase, partial [Polyangia bacterium]|nr:CDP-diacylglycerol--serine O-phosphatidyltransferase [Polyangia bacterium]